MDCRQWAIPDLRGLDFKHFEDIRNFINEQRWLMNDLVVARKLNVDADWLECFLIYLTTYIMDYKDLTNAPHDAHAAAAFVYEHFSWMRPFLLHYIKHIDASFLAQNNI